MMTFSADCQLRPLARGDLDLVLGWRNSPEIRRYMFTHREISRSEHFSWYQLLSSDDTRRALIFEDEGIAKGFVQFSNVHPDAAIHWGFYTAPNTPSGTGRKLGVAALDFAFRKLNASKVVGQALESNAPSIGFHKSLGFSQVGETIHRPSGEGKNEVVLVFELSLGRWAEIEDQSN